jgi:hypothetical protein
MNNIIESFDEIYKNMLIKNNIIKDVASSFISEIIENCWWPVQEIQYWNLTKKDNCDPNETCILCLNTFAEVREEIQYKANCCNIYYHHSCVNNMNKRDFKMNCIHCNKPTC